MLGGGPGAAGQGAAPLAAEESSGRLGLVLSTRLGRSRFWLGWWAATLLSAACVLVLSASVLGVSIWGVADRSVPVASVLEVGWAYLPPVVLIGALQALLASLGPRWCALGWVPVAWTAVVGFLAEALRLPEWARDLSPAHMVGSLPVDDPDPRVITGQCAAAAALLGACSSASGKALTSKIAHETAMPSDVAPQVASAAASHPMVPARARRRLL